MIISPVAQTHNTQIAYLHGDNQMNWNACQPLFALIQDVPRNPLWPPDEIRIAGKLHGFWLPALGSISYFRGFRRKVPAG